MPVSVRNTEDGPTVFMDPVSKLQIEWKGAGDATGGDIQLVPDDLVTDNVQFINAMTRGLFEVVEASPEVQEAFAKQTEAYQRRKDEAKAASAAAIDPGAQEDFISVPCIGPGVRGGVCQNPVAVKERKRDERPPLCSEHAHLAHEYSLIADLSGPITEEGERMKWVRMQREPREVQTTTASQGG